MRKGFIHSPSTSRTVYKILFITCSFILSLSGCQSKPSEPIETVDEIEIPIATITDTATPIPTTTVMPVETQEPVSTSSDNQSIDDRRATRTAAAGMVTPLPPTSGQPRATQTSSSQSLEQTISVEPEPMVPLTDMGEATYYGFSGGIYPNGQNEMPANHAKEGLKRAKLIQSLNMEGLPNQDGKYILLSIGMSNTGMEFCVALGLHHDYNLRSCTPYSFMGLSAGDPDVNHNELVILNGARGGQVGDQWNSPSHQNYDRIRNELLSPRGLSEEQVQIIWLKVVNRPLDLPSLPSEQADAYFLSATLADIVRAFKERYPNLQQVFLSSRIYAGYANEIGELRNPEPYAYESGFAVKWLIEAQIEQMETGRINPITGDLDYDSVAPWLAWGPYIWADGVNPRSDGLFWVRDEFSDDGVHPSVHGRTKVAKMLFDFFTTNPMTVCWFLTAGDCG
jgi:hypothetical protein